MTRPNIVYIVSIYSRYSKVLLSTHNIIFKRIISYLVRIIKLGLHYSSKKGTKKLLVRFIDSS